MLGGGYCTSAIHCRQLASKSRFGGFERWRTSISALSIALIGRGSPAFLSPLLLTFLFSTRD
jgi:hypothetical protein